jgi:hypothetical protein
LRWGVCSAQVLGTLDCTSLYEGYQRLLSQVCLHTGGWLAVLVACKLAFLGTLVMLLLCGLCGHALFRLPPYKYRWLDERGDEAAPLLVRRARGRPQKLRCLTVCACVVGRFLTAAEPRLHQPNTAASAGPRARRQR